MVPVQYTSYAAAGLPCPWVLTAVNVACQQGRDEMLQWLGLIGSTCDPLHVAW